MTRIRAVLFRQKGLQVSAVTWQAWPPFQWVPDVDTSRTWGLRPPNGSEHTAGSRVSPRYFVHTTIRKGRKVISKKQVKEENERQKDDLPYSSRPSTVWEEIRKLYAITRSSRTSHQQERVSPTQIDLHRKSRCLNIQPGPLPAFAHGAKIDRAFNGTTAV